MKAIAKITFITLAEQVKNYFKNFKFGFIEAILLMMALAILLLPLS